MRLTLGGEGMTKKHQDDRPTPSSPMTYEYFMKLAKSNRKRGNIALAELHESCAESLKKSHCLGNACRWYEGKPTSLCGRVGVLPHCGYELKRERKEQEGEL